MECWRRSESRRRVRDRCARGWPSRPAESLVTIPRYIMSVLNSQTTRPVRSATITPPRPPIRTRRRCITCRVAARASMRPYSTSAQMSRATVARMKNSPVPVHDTAHDALLAYVPAPITAESPTRPGSLFVSPPVDVAAARSPCTSSATAPTVPCEPSRGARTRARPLEGLPSFLGPKVLGRDELDTVRLRKFDSAGARKENVR